MMKLLSMIVLVLIVSGPLAAAKEVLPTEDPFGKGNWTFQVYGSTTFAGSDKGFLHASHIGLGYFFLDKVSINIEGVGGWVDAKKDDDGGFGGFDLLFRWHFYQRGDFSIFGDGGAGFQEATTNFPSDSHHNFRPQVGFGATWQVTHDLMLVGGAKWLHVSNAGTSDINDGLDAAEVYLGIMMPF